MVDIILNVVGESYKRRDQLCKNSKAKVVKVILSEKNIIGIGLNQETSLTCADSI
jgi:hypothetical protein